MLKWKAPRHIQTLLPAAGERFLPLTGWGMDSGYDILGNHSFNQRLIDTNFHPNQFSLDNTFKLIGLCLVIYPEC
jgi:hypothetical protein